MILFFENVIGKRKFVGKPKTIAEAEKMIIDFCKKRKYEVPYFREWETSWGNNEKIKVNVFDVGSHAEFFYMANVKTMKELSKYATN